VSDGLALRPRCLQVTPQRLAGAAKATYLLDEVKDVGRHNGSLRRPSPGQEHRTVLEPDGVDHFGEVCPRFAHLHGAGNQVHAYMVTDCPKSLLVQLASLYNSVMSNATATPASETRCLRCHRVLKSARSVAARYGKGCSAKIRQAALNEARADFTADQQSKATELIRDGGLVPTNREGVFRAVSSKGDETYLVHAAACTCPGGLRAKRPCYHTLAARILGIASRRSMTKAA
jgi:hypothetical protein